MVNPKTGAKLPAKPAQPEKPGSTHKDRTEWFYERAAFPFRDAPPLDLEKFWELDLSIKGRPDLKWEEAGPRNIAGRVTSLAYNRVNPQTLYAGSAAGGVWRSDNAGASWVYAWERAANQNIGAIAIHPRETNRLIVATGEANQSADTYPGSGFFTSLNGGKSWSPFFTMPGGAPLPRGSSEQLPRRVGSIAFDPHNVLYGAVGSLTHDERMRAGLYLIRFDEGLVPCTFWSNRSYNCHSVMFHPLVKGLLFAAIEPRGSQNGIWRSQDSGESWERLMSGLPEGPEFGRATLVLAPSQPDTMYLLAADRERRLLGVFRSVDQGDSWVRIASRDDELFADERFLSYNNTIVVHPDNPDFVIWGGANLYRTSHAGRTGKEEWEKITTVEQFEDPFTRQRPVKNYVHEDHHALLMPGGNVVYSGNDGGVAVSLDGGANWDNSSKGMVTTMFYAVDVAKNSKVFGGGAQDNGTLITGVAIGDGRNATMLPEGDFIQPFSGDGGWIVFDPTDEEKVFGSFQNVNVMRHQRGQLWLSWFKVLDSEKVIDFAERNQRSIAVLAIEPGPVSERSRRVWAGTSRLWRTDDDGKSWNPVSRQFDRSVISAIDISTVNPKIMYVGTTSGGIYRSTDGGDNWTQDIGGKDMARRLITRIETHPTEPETVVVVIAATGLAGVKLMRTKVPRFESPFIQSRGETEEEKPYSHVFLSTDMGVTWTDIDGGSLPNVVFHAAVFETRSPFRLFIGGDIGVMVRAANGVDWEILSGGLPNVVVSDLVYHGEDQLLFAATYGRGIWRLHTDRLLSGLP